MDQSILYILYVITSICLFNALIVMARYVNQTKKPPAEADYDHLESERKSLEGMIEKQNQEIVELQIRIKELEATPEEAEEPQDEEEAS